MVELSQNRLEELRKKGAFKPGGRKILAREGFGADEREQLFNQFGPRLEVFGRRSLGINTQRIKQPGGPDLIVTTGTQQGQQKLIPFAPKSQRELESVSKFGTPNIPASGNNPSLDPRREPLPEYASGAIAKTTGDRFGNIPGTSRFQSASGAIAPIVDAKGKSFFKNLASDLRQNSRNFGEKAVERISETDYIENKVSFFKKLILPTVEQSDKKSNEKISDLREALARQEQDINDRQEQFNQKYGGRTLSEQEFKIASIEQQNIDEAKKNLKSDKEAFTDAANTVKGSITVAGGKISQAFGEFIASQADILGTTSEEREAKKSEEKLTQSQQKEAIELDLRRFANSTDTKEQAEILQKYKDIVNPDLTSIGIASAEALASTNLEEKTERTIGDIVGGTAGNILVGELLGRGGPKFVKKVAGTEVTAVKPTITTRAIDVIEQEVSEASGEVTSKGKFKMETDISGQQIGVTNRFGRFFGDDVDIATISEPRKIVTIGGIIQKEDEIGQGLAATNKFSTKSKASSDVIKIEAGIQKEFDASKEMVITNKKLKFDGLDIDISGIKDPPVTVLNPDRLDGALGKFRPSTGEVSISSELRGKEKAIVTEHEKVHFFDYKKGITKEIMENAELKPTKEAMLIEGRRKLIEKYGIDVPYDLDNDATVIKELLANKGKISESSKNIIEGLTAAQDKAFRDAFATDGFFVKRSQQGIDSTTSAGELITKKIGTVKTKNVKDLDFDSEAGVLGADLLRSEDTIIKPARAGSRTRRFDLVSESFTEFENPNVEILSTKLGLQEVTLPTESFRKPRGKTDIIDGRTIVKKRNDIDDYLPDEFSSIGASDTVVQQAKKSTANQMATNLKAAEAAFAKQIQEDVESFGKRKAGQARKDIVARQETFGADLGILSAGAEIILPDVSASPKAVGQPAPIKMESIESVFNQQANFEVLSFAKQPRSRSRENLALDLDANVRVRQTQDSDSLTKQLEKELQKEALESAQVPKLDTSTRQVPKSIQKEFAALDKIDLLEPVTFSPPRRPPRLTPSRRIPDIDIDLDAKKIEDDFDENIAVQVRKKGKFETIAQGLDLEEAVDVGRRATRGSLAQTFRLIGDLDEDELAVAGFRKPKGKSKIDSFNTFIESNPLASDVEVDLLKAARKRKMADIP